ncbi:ferric iron reductase FhuF-like transporter [Paractinoplanes brasiliensis]|uniref:Ferric iron reductase FhuF-like transporter n=2 Tax=Paractinoplanes brasiliensis TaxID=52695 RepID=A0A4R6JUY1_9ACTN|nr:ferric iron reductase FhuF-like transporter [Actinoplanes brasiliensis]
MTTALHRTTRTVTVADPLAPVKATLRAMFGTSTELPGVAPDLVVHDPTDWTPASALAGEQLDILLESSRRRWNAQPHAAAALAWKAYTYWVALPAVLGYASARRVPLLTADNVLTHFDDPRPLITVGLRAGTPVAVLAGDPLALSGLPHVRVVPDEAALLVELRRSLLDQHLSPLLDAIHDRVRLGKRTLLGSLSSGVAYGVLRSADVLPGRSAETIAQLHNALGVEDLIELVPGSNGKLDVQRKTCCLAFTLPQPKVCQGCCIKS